jgi:hypothetical protein
MSRPPDIGEVLTPVLARIPPERQPLLVAVAERLAAERYRRWAGQPELADDAGRLRACALREETIAAKVEALFRDVDALTREILSEVPELEALNRELFDGRPLREQLAIQARGEHLGAATWRAFARQANGAERQAFEACAPLEEKSAAVLEGILRRS